MRWLLVLVILAVLGPGLSASEGGEEGLLVLTVNPLGLVLGSLVTGGLDLAVDCRLSLSPRLAAGLEPELAFGDYAGFALQAGLLYFPLATAPEGFNLRVYGGYGRFGGEGSALLSLTAGWQFLGERLVFCPEIGFRYAYWPGLLLRPGFGLALRFR